jgi:hypothetical protein
MLSISCIAATPMSRSEGPARPRQELPIRAGHTVLLDDSVLLEQDRLEQHSCLSIRSGLVRVAMSQPDQEALQAPTITLGFLQTGDHLSLDLLRTVRLHVKALIPSLLESHDSPIPPLGASSLQEWTVDLLVIRHLSDAPLRLRGLLQLLVRRLGRRGPAGYELPLRLTHADLAELSGQNRATVTRQLCRWRELGLIEQASCGRGAGEAGGLRLAPQLIDD